MLRNNRWLFLFPLALLLVGLVACSGDDNAASTTATRTPAGSAGATTSAAVSATAGDPVKVGAIFSQSGNFAPYGAAQVGVDLAIKDINAAGGVTINGVNHQFEMVARDDRSDTSVATAAALELTDDQKVTVLAASVLNNITGAILPVAEDHNVIMFAPGTILDPELTADHTAFPSGQARRVFKTGVAGSELYGGYGNIIHAFDPTIKHVVMLWPDASATTLNEPYFRSGAEKLGMTVDIIKYPTGTTDFSSFLLQVKDKNPDILFLSFVQADALASLRQAIDLNASPRFMGVNLSPTIATKDATGGPITQPFLLFGSTRLAFDPTTPESKDYYTRYAATGQALDANAGFSLFFYDYIRMVAKAMEKAGTVTDTDKIAQALVGLQYKGVEGDMTYGAQHFPVQGYDYCTILTGTIKCQVAEKISRGS
jgi:branched-chain amino acid transport system substrate-binding protein